MMQLELFNNNPQTPLTEEKVLNIQAQTENVKKTTDKIIDTEKYNFKQENYESYKISIEKGKISKVYFSIWKYKFLVHIDIYSFQSKDVPINHYYETDATQRDATVSTYNLGNLKIQWIQRKERAWYGAFKEYVEYFRFAGIKYSTLKRFLESLIKQYHWY